MHTQPRWMTVAGWILTGLLCALLCFSGVMKLLSPPEMPEQWVDKFGYPLELLTPIGIVELACVALYLAPPTSILGAVLLTGYLGGAVATHARIQDPWVPPVVIGVIVWLAMFLRDPRVRALLPVRRPLPTQPVAQ